MGTNASGRPEWPPEKVEYEMEKSKKFLFIGFQSFFEILVDVTVLPGFAKGKEPHFPK